MIFAINIFFEFCVASSSQNPPPNGTAVPQPDQESQGAQSLLNSSQVERGGGSTAHFSSDAIQVAQSLRMELERMNWKHQAEIDEMQFNHELSLKEFRASQEIKNQKVRKCHLKTR